MPQKSKNKISQNAIKHYNQLINVRTGALIWVNMNTDIGIKLKVVTTVKDRYQQLLDFITIGVLKNENQHPLSQYIITLPMTPIIKIYFKKHSMSWEIIHIYLRHPYYSVVKSMCPHQTLCFR